MDEVMEVIEMTGEHQVITSFETMHVEAIELKDEVGFLSFDLTQESK